VIGLQWGDEAKGKLVDLLTEQHDIVVRYQGGANAGHTVVARGQTYKLSLIPSGILSPRVKSVITGGVVINPPTVLAEIAQLKERGVQVASNLLISDRAHVIFPWHMAEDRAMDGCVAGGEAIGTTGRGIGPCYRDKVGRAYAIRLSDMYRPDFTDKVRHVCEAKNRALAGMAAGTPSAANASLDAGQIAREYADYAAQMKPYVGDTTEFLLDAVESNQRVLFEGAQGALLDIDHGTFPYVTSSNSSGVGVASGSGVPAKWVNKVIGVIKAYSTRVGGGPFPTEQDNETGQHLRDRGNEYGTVTRRPRRCGWFDAVAARYTARLSGVDSLAVMLLDVLSGLDEIKVCVEYEINGRRTKQFPSHVDDLRQAKPVYETLPGWQIEISDLRSFDDLPANARAYLARLSQLVGPPVEVVSVGPDREQTIFAKSRRAAAASV
jgi:adenylosuccinate synthase